MQRIIIEQSEADLTSHAGLGLIGMALNERTDLREQAKAAAPARSDAMAHGNILNSHIGLLCLGKSAFEAVNGMREDEYFAASLGLKQVPSGKFATNALVLACAQLAYNIPRWIGQNGWLGPDAPPRHKAKRRRIRTVMQELMYLAARLIRTGRRLKLAFGRGCLAVPIFRRLYLQLA